MKRTVITVTTGLALALGTSTIALAATTTTADVRTLAAAESRVVALLDHYSNSPTWKAEYKAALAVQTPTLRRLMPTYFQ